MGKLKRKFKMPVNKELIKARIRVYERTLQQQLKEANGSSINDEFGKRHLLGPLYVLLGDIKGALKSFEWYEEMFPNEDINSWQYLSWILALYKDGQLEQAEKKLLKLAFNCRTMLPYLFEENVEHLRPEFPNLNYSLEIPKEFLNLWGDNAKEWAKKIFYSEKLKNKREKYFELDLFLKKERNTIKKLNFLSEYESFRNQFKQEFGFECPFVYSIPGLNESIK